MLWMFLKRLAIQNDVRTCVFSDSSHAYCLQYRFLNCIIFFKFIRITSMMNQPIRINPQERETQSGLRNRLLEVTTVPNVNKTTKRNSLHARGILLFICNDAQYLWEIMIGRDCSQVCFI